MEPMYLSEIEARTGDTPLARAVREARGFLPQIIHHYNRWCDAAGVHAMPEEAHLLSARQMASRGYQHDL